MKAFNVGTQHVIVRADSASTGGVCALLEMHHQPDTGPPLHKHSLEDEGFFVLAGTYRFTVGNEEKILGPGEFAMAAREVPHSFRSLGPELGKMLIYLTPGGLESYFEEMSQISKDDPDEHLKCKELDLKYGIQILKAAQPKKT